MGRLYPSLTSPFTFAFVSALAALYACQSSNPATLTQGIGAPQGPAPSAWLPIQERTPAGADPSPCTSSAECADGNPCTIPACVEGLCAFEALPIAECCVPTSLGLYSFDEGDLETFEADALMSGARWALSDERAVSPPTSLAFGDPDAGALGEAQRVVGAVRLAPMTLPDAPVASLTMRLFLDIEAASHRDQLELFADILGPNDAPVDTVLLWRKDDAPVEAYAGFALVTVSLAELAGQRLRIRVDFDSVLPPSPASAGVFIDDLEVITECPAGSEPLLEGAGAIAGGGRALGPSERGEGGRDSGNASSEPSRSGSGSTPGQERSREGARDRQSDDGAGSAPGAEPHGDGAPSGAASSGALVSGGQGGGGGDPCAAPDAHAGCCTSDAECDDGNPATINVCEGAECVASWNPDGCLSDAECADDEPCTVDRCVESLCVHEGTFGSLCCEAEVVPLADFDGESLDGLFVTDNLETGVFWRPDPTRATSGAFALYCGDPETQTYALGERIKSSATTPVVTLPKGGQTSLRFDLFMATRPAATLDVFQVFVLRQGVLHPVWSSKVFATGSTQGFLPIDVDLSSFAGQALQLRFVFDSVDGAASGFEGTYIDALRLETTCL